MWTELEQLSTVPVHRMLVPVHPSIFETLTAFQDLRVCQSLNGSYETYKIVFLQCLQVIFYYIIVICNTIGEICEQRVKFFFFKYNQSLLASY